MSSSPAWMPLHVADYLRDTGHLNVAEHGAYLLLIMRYWQDGGLPPDEKLIMRYAHLTAEQWSESRDVLVALFDEGWKHKRIDEELAKAAEIIGKRKAAAQQRHSKSDAHAEQVQSISSYTGVPPEPKPKPEKQNPAPLSDAEGARDLFDQVWEVFPMNPTSSESKARSAFERLKAKDQVKLLAAAERYGRWFVGDCAARKRSEDAGLKFVPHLATWIESGGWREAQALPIAGEMTVEQEAVLASVETVDRFADEALFKACEQIRGRPAPATIQRYAFPKEVVAEARKKLAA